MAGNDRFEIPEQVRDVAQRNIEQTRAAYNQFMDMARKAQEMAAQQSGTMVEAALEIQSKALSFAEENTRAGFNLASELAKAKDLQEYVEIQQRHAQQQMKTFAEQSQRLGQMMSEAAQRAAKR
ncbi:MAG: phasin family protein [Hyphomicrobiaceae bacterium]